MIRLLVYTLDISFGPLLPRPMASSAAFMSRPPHGIVHVRFDVGTSPNSRPPLAREARLPTIESLARRLLIKGGPPKAADHREGTARDARIGKCVEGRSGICLY